MKYAGVVILYNPNCENVLKNIDTYIDEIEKLYVIDNSSFSHEKKFNNKKIEYIFNGKNLGIATALNIGANNAIKENYDWLLTMDQDSYFDKNALKNMINFIETTKNNNDLSIWLNVEYSRIGIVSPFHKTKQSGFIPHGGLNFPLMVMTSGNMINLKVYEKVNGFKDSFFIDCVDFDYCLKLQQKNYLIIQINSSLLNHSLGDIKLHHFLNKYVYTSNHNYIRRYYIIRNRNYINKIYKKDFPSYCKCEMKQTKKEIIKILLFEKDKIRKFKYMLRGYRDYKKHITGGLNE